MKPVMMLLLISFICIFAGCQEKQNPNMPNSVKVENSFKTDQVFQITENNSYVLFKVDEDVQLALKSILFSYKINKSQIQIFDRESSRLIANAKLSKTDKEFSGNIDRVASNKIVLNKNFKGTRLELNVLDESKSLELIKDNAISDLQVLDRNLTGKNLTIKAKSYNGKNEDNVLIKINDVPLASNPSLPKTLQDNRDLMPFVFNDQLLMVKRLDSSLSAHKYQILDSVNLDDFISEDFNVTFSFTSLDEKYSKITFVVENLKDDKAFIISNPFESLKLNKCLGISKLTNYRSIRIQNKIVLEFSYLKNKSFACLENDFQGSVFVIDSKMKNIKVDFN